MATISNAYEQLSPEQIERFEIARNLILPPKYKNFLLQWNGGSPVPDMFMISDEQGASVVNVFNGIGEMYDNLEKVMEIYEDRLPEGFIPIGDDPGGNVLCVGTKELYAEKIYFWDHEQEPEDPNEMTNMYFLANDIYEFLDALYEGSEE